MMVPHPFQQKLIEIVDDPKYGQKEAARLAKVSVTTIWRITENGTASRRTLRKISHAFPAFATIIIQN